LDSKDQPASHRIWKISRSNKLGQKIENEGNPYVILHKRQVPCVEMAHEIAVESKDHARNQAGQGRHGEGPHENIHEDAAQQAVHDGGIGVSPLGTDQVVKEPQGIEHGGLDIGDKRCTRKIVPIPEWKGALRPEMIINELFPRKELEDKIGTIQQIRGADDPSEKKKHRQNE